ncbi:LuxR C-terminal-related transcriptional regulator [Draconibacterium sp. IB214405]|uniref:LuxR C-terminal-related transcriptional regulator n=1 Tax=Draconibacterium sp. IB214405 TaxID=3097352 RepID=UPI002A0D1362|nr:LuxR C-terminal-related transcriptional regulator [Draconibacterium sp. IB214405]MDX8338398.1 LuxR C-terminal-related transcriptional regulator [Draconibacterium sp. IB214405]
MDEKSINKIKKAWEPNKVKIPVKTELYLNIIEQVVNLFTPGSFYYYIMNFGTFQMDYVDARIETVLGVNIKDWNLERMFELVHPEDQAQMHRKEAKAIEFILNRIPKEQILKYKVVYLLRLRHANGNYKTILQQSKALTLSEDGKVQQVLGIHTDVTHLNMAIDHKISFIGDGLPSYYSLSTDDEFHPEELNYHTLFTTREIEILANIAKGKTFAEIAEVLNISPHTINTHKKNILKKTDCNNTTELIARCVREGVI